MNYKNKKGEFYMKNFLKGLVVGSIGIAVIQNLVQLINGCGDLLTNKLSIQGLKDQKTATLLTKEIEEIGMESEPVQTQCIGFEVPSDDCDCYEIEEDKKARRRR